MLKAGKKRARREHEKLKRVEYQLQLDRKEFIKGALVKLNGDKQVFSLSDVKDGIKYELVEKREVKWRTKIFVTAFGDYAEEYILNPANQIYTIKHIHQSGWAEGLLIELEGFGSRIHSKELRVVKSAPKRTIF